MIQKIFLNMLEISITTSAVILLMCVLSPILEKRYNARWKYYVWLGIVIRLLIPIPFTIPDAPIQINTEQVFQESENWQAPLPSEIVINDEIQSSNGKQGSSVEPISLLRISTVIWVVGGCGYFIYYLLQYLCYVKNIKRWSLGVASEQKIMFDKIKADLEIKRKVSLRYCKIIKSPMMFGINHPTVLIPCEKYPEIDLYLIIKHELMHYKRHDIEVKFLLFLVQTLYWFNPLVHLMSKKLNQTIEMSCDEHVISGNDAVYKKRYMETILQSMKQQNIRTSVFTSNYNGGMKAMKKRFENITHNGNKKKGLVTLTLFIVVSLALSSLVACNSTEAVATGGKAVQNTANEEKGVSDTTKQENTEIKSEAVTAGGKAVQNTANEKKEVGDTAKKENAKIKEPKKLSKNIVGVYAESKRNPQLEKTIIDYLKIPTEDLAKTKYYYNYVDLNRDGYDEIFVVVMGPYTSGTGGSTALHIVISGKGEMNVNQKFTLINTPIIISDKVTKGCNEIIVMRRGGGAESNYVVLTARDGQYTSVNEGTVIKGLEGVSGKAIISNDILKDMEEGKALYLQK